MSKRNVIFFVLVSITALCLANNSSFTAAEASWTTLASIPTGRTLFGITPVNGKIYAIGGRNDLISHYLDINEMYDPQVNTWTTKAPMPTQRMEFATAVFRSKIYIIGGVTLDDNPPKKGKTPTGLNQVYDIETNTWETKSPMPTPRSGSCANVVNGKIYVIGGFQEYSTYPLVGASFKNEVYDPETDTWTTETPIPISVESAASAVVDDKIHVLGGREGPFLVGYQNLHQVYHTENDTWITAQPVPVGLHSAAAGATTGILAPKKIYLLGGWLLNDQITPCNLTQVYNPEQDSWTNATSMPTMHADFGIAVINDELYAISGWRQGFQSPSVENEKYTPTRYTDIPNGTEPFLKTMIVIVTVSTVVVGTGLLIHFRKRKHQEGKNDYSRRF